MQNVKDYLNNKNIITMIAIFKKLFNNPKQQERRKKRREKRGVRKIKKGIKILGKDLNPDDIKKSKDKLNLKKVTSGGLDTTEGKVKYYTGLINSTRLDAETEHGGLTQYHLKKIKEYESNITNLGYKYDWNTRKSTKVLKEEAKPKQENVPASDFWNDKIDLGFIKPTGTQLVVGGTAAILLGGMALKSSNK